MAKKVTIGSGLQGSVATTVGTFHNLGRSTMAITGIGADTLETLQDEGSPLIVKSIKDLFTESKLEETQRLTDESDARRELNVSKTAELESANKLLEAQLANKRLQAELNKTEPAVETPKPE